ncbi:MAG: hypothetical protein IKX45_03365 [Bacteroidales bacterium]|nr:hypothetical protein [Bacteroidales bacterium]
MKLFHYLAVIALVLGLMSCTKDEEKSIDPNSNWWYRANVVQGGIKTITQSDGLYYEYNKKGLCILLRASNSYGNTTEITYSYNSKNLPAKIVTKETMFGLNKTITQIFEYNNNGKYCPVPRDAGSAGLYWDTQGLLPGLSKITWITEGDEGYAKAGTVVSDYIFNESKLTIKTSGGYTDVVIDYEEAYPIYSNLSWYCIGPCTYHPNGMLQTYVEGFTEQEVINGTVHTRFYKNHNNSAMLLEKDVDSTGGKVISEKTFTYNTSGDEIKMVSETLTRTTAYEYDNKGNWIKKTSTSESSNGEQQTVTTTRTITYY